MALSEARQTYKADTGHNMKKCTAKQVKSWKCTDLKEGGMVCTKGEGKEIEACYVPTDD